MFEQSVLPAQQTNSKWTFAVSLTTEVALILLAIAIPLIYTEPLPVLTKLVGTISVPPPAAAPAEAAVLQSSARRSPLEPPIFRAPKNIPEKIADLHDLSQTTLEPSPSIGVVGSIGSSVGDGALGRLLSSVLPATKPPEPSPAAAPRQPRGPMRVSQGVQEAKLLRRVMPVYPPLAITARVQGTVHLVGVIAKDGTMRDLQVVDGHPLLVRAALDAVRQWVYKPTMLSGEAVEVVAPISVTFTLGR